MSTIIQLSILISEIVLLVLWFSSFAMFPLVIYPFMKTADPKVLTATAPLIRREAIYIRAIGISTTVAYFVLSIFPVFTVQNILGHLHNFGFDLILGIMLVLYAVISEGFIMRYSAKLSVVSSYRSKSADGETYAHEKLAQFVIGRVALFASELTLVLLVILVFFSVYL